MSGIAEIFTDFLPAVATYLGESYTGIAMQGIDDRDYRPVNWTHFIPCTSFERKKDPEKTYKFNADCIEDLINGDKYLDDDQSVVRFKCLALAAATPIVHAIGLLINLACRIAKVITFAHFWYSCETQYSLRERALTFGRDVLRVVFTPVFYIGLELSAFWGLALPYDGRKLYAAFERCAYGKELLAPCFQPDPKGHLGGGSLNEKNAW